MTGFDTHEHQVAGRLSERCPDWLVMWGTWSRRFWAYPLFRAPRGTIINAATASDLLTLMSRAELDTAGPGAWGLPWPPAGPHSRHPPGDTSS